MPAHKMPTAVLEARGSFKKDPQRRPKAEPEPTGGIGPAPKHMSELESAVWDELVSNCAPGVLANMDKMHFEITVKLAVKMRYEWEKMSCAEMSQLTKNLGLMGMNPVDRSRVHAKPQKKQNPFDRFK